jgi:hypothetical protein
MRCIERAEDDLVDGYFVDSLIKSEIVQEVYAKPSVCLFLLLTFVCHPLFSIVNLELVQ